MTDELSASASAGAVGKVRATEVGRQIFSAARVVAVDRRRARIASLCELVAEDVPVKEAAKLVGVSETTATGMMAQVRRELGWQAK